MIYLLGTYLRNMWFHVIGSLWKVKVWLPAIALLTWVDSQTAGLYNLGSGSWLAWAISSTAHYAAIHCPRLRIIGPALQHDRYTTTPVSCTRPLLRSPLVYSNRGFEIWTCDLTIASTAFYHMATSVQELSWEGAVCLIDWLIERLIITLYWKTALPVLSVVVCLLFSLSLSLSCFYVSSTKPACSILHWNVILYWIHFYHRNLDFFPRKHIPTVYGHFSSNTLQRSANINWQVVSVAGSRGLSQKGVHNMVWVASLACLRHYLY